MFIIALILAAIYFILMGLLTGFSILLNVGYSIGALLCVYGIYCIGKAYCQRN